MLGFSCGLFIAGITVGILNGMIDDSIVQSFHSIHRSLMRIEEKEMIRMLPKVCILPFTIPLDCNEKNLAAFEYGHDYLFNRWLLRSYNRTATCSQASLSYLYIPLNSCYGSGMIPTSAWKSIEKIIQSYANETRYFVSDRTFLSLTCPHHTPRYTNEMYMFNRYVHDLRPLRIDSNYPLNGRQLIVPPVLPSDLPPAPSFNGPDRACLVLVVLWKDEERAAWNEQMKAAFAKLPDNMTSPSFMRLEWIPLRTIPTFAAPPSGENSKRRVLQKHVHGEVRKEVKKASTSKGKNEVLPEKSPGDRLPGWNSYTFPASLSEEELQVVRLFSSSTFCILPADPRSGSPSPLLLFALHLGCVPIPLCPSPACSFHRPDLPFATLLKWEKGAVLGIGEHDLSDVDRLKRLLTMLYELKSVRSEEGGATLDGLRRASRGLAHLLDWRAHGGLNSGASWPSVYHLTLIQLANSLVEFRGGGEKGKVKGPGGDQWRVREMEREAYMGKDIVLELDANRLILEKSM